jgi:uncharacterized membrane protein YuzA (DUF378 family)
MNASTNNDKVRRRNFSMKTLDYIALILVAIGAINWGLIGFFDFNLVRALFGDMTMVSRIIYALVGIAGLYSLSFFGRLRNED